MNDLTITIATKRSAHEVFETIRDVRGWWSRGIEGRADAVGDTFFYRYEDLHASTQELVELVPDRKLAWRVTDATLSFTEKKDEWRGTTLVFELAERGGETEVRFTHVGLSGACECFDACSKGWAFYVGESLGRAIATGHGKPDAVERAHPRK